MKHNRCFFAISYVFVVVFSMLMLSSCSLFGGKTSFWRQFYPACHCFPVFRSDSGIGVILNRHYCINIFRKCRCNYNVRHGREIFFLWDIR